MRTTQDRMDHDPRDETDPGPGPGSDSSGNVPTPQPQANISDEQEDDDDMQLNPEDVIEVIDLDEGDGQAPDGGVLLWKKSYSW